MINCCHVVSGLHPKSGGPSRTVTQLLDSLASYHDQIAINLVSQKKAGDPILLPSSAYINSLVTETKSSLAYRTAYPIKRSLKHSLLERMDIVHNHGLWLPANYWAYQYAKKEGKPLVIHTRGMLEDWALTQSVYKKKAALLCFQNNMLKKASAFIATSESECLSLRKFGLTQPIAIIPNGVNLERMEVSARRRCGERKTALFLSRVHKKKGLLNLIRAWALVSPEGWSLKIAGPDESHLNEVLAEARHLGVIDRVEYVGEVYGEKKNELYQSADLFILPTLSENFGVVVVEALANHLPVITTKGAPWADIVQQGCGWWIDIGVEPLAVALREATNLSNEKLKIMGDAGANYAKRFDWKDIAHSTLLFYQWLMTSVSKPGFVHEL